MKTLTKVKYESKSIFIKLDDELKERRTTSSVKRTRKKNIVR